MTSDSLPKANKILIDVPCSGTGVINRRVDLRWKRTLNDIEKSSSIQYNILEHVSKFLLDKGVIVYSTCSIEKEENFDVINKFLDYYLDGGFAVRLRKI